MANKEIELNVHFNRGIGPVVLLIHGVEDSGQFWKPIDAILAKKLHVVSVDLLGFGDSSKSPSGKYTLEENVLALENTIKNLDYQEKIMIVGHSMGTFVALEFAKRNPDRVNQIILTSPVFIFKGGNLNYKRPTEFLQNIFLSLASVPRKVMLTISESVATTYRAIFKRTVRFMPSIMSIDSIIDQQEPIPLLAAVKKTPVTILFGYFDNLVINSNVEYVTKKFPNIKSYGFNRFHDIPHKEMNFLIKTITTSSEKMS